MMSMKACYVYWILLWFATGCMETGDSRYRDISSLEKPPTLAIVKTNASEPAGDEVDKSESAQTGSNKGLAHLLTLEGSDERPVLRIKTRYERAWEMVGRALTVGKIEVLDKNREDGVYKVSFDPDSAEQDSGGALGAVFAYFNDQLPAADYELTLAPQAAGVTVSAQRLKAKDKSRVVDNKDGFNDSAAAAEEEDDHGQGAAALVKRLNQIIKDEFLK